MINDAVNPFDLSYICDWVFHTYVGDKTENIGKTGIILCYSSSHNLEACLDSLHPHGKYILIFRDSDNPLVDAHVIKHPNIVYWFATNCVSTLPNVEAMPAGIFCGSKLSTQITQEKIRECNNTNLDIKNEVFACFSINNRSERELAAEFAKQTPYISWYEKLNADIFYKEMKQHNFALSPFGCGEDCMRTWEALALGIIPIVKAHRSTKRNEYWSRITGGKSIYHWFNDMPIALIDSYEEITEAWLNEQKGVAKTKSCDRLRIGYWNDRIRTVVKDIL